MNEFRARTNDVIKNLETEVLSIYYQLDMIVDIFRIRE